jgi:hypothetical protein
MMAEETLWCVHVLGPDDMVPTACREHAVNLAAHISDTEKRFNAGYPDDQWVMFTPMIEVWTGPAHQHAHWLKRRGERNADYPLLDCEKVE